MIAISTLYFDPLGALVFDEVPQDAVAALSVSRRVTRTPTLDGGASIVDGGYSAADRTITLKLVPETPLEDVLNLQRIVKTYSLVLVLTSDGAFLTAPRDFVVSGGRATATFLVKSVAEVRL
jgi:hypothetical protein